MNHRRLAVVSLVALAMLVPSVLCAEGQETIKGRVQDVRPAARQVTITTDQGKEVTLHLDGQSRLALDDFRKGMRVKATFERKDGDNRLVAMTPAPVTAEELRNEFRTTLKDAKSYTFEHKGEYYQKLQGLLGQVDEAIDQLKRKAAPATAEAKKQYAEQIEQLRRLRDKAEVQAERVKSATPGAWEDVKSGLYSAFEDLRNAFEKAAEHFR